MESPVTERIQKQKIKEKNHFPGNILHQARGKTPLAFGSSHFNTYHQLYLTTLAVKSTNCGTLVTWQVATGPHVVIDNIVGRSRSGPLFSPWYQLYHPITTVRGPLKQLLSVLRSVNFSLSLSLSIFSVIGLELYRVLVELCSSDLELSVRSVPKMPAVYGSRLTTFEDSEKESEYGYVRKVRSTSLLDSNGSDSSSSVSLNSIFNSICFVCVLIEFLSGWISALLLWIL